jgi:hypothetical protein
MTPELYAHEERFKRMQDLAPELVEALRKAIEWDGYDEHGWPAVWLEEARALFARIEGGKAR